jgi:DNA-binding transcriptional MerR regulator
MQQLMNSFTIKDLENLSGIKAHTIRIWEQRYTFLKPKRTETNIRNYNNEDLKVILNVALLNKYGYKISHINRMTEEEVRDKILALNQLQAQHERIVNDIIHFMVDLNIDAVEVLLDNHIMSRGVEKTIVNIIFPFLERIGILWLTNHINPAQEHLITNLIRQKLLVGIERATSHTDTGKTALLFLPEGEHHELGLLFVYYLLRSRGVKVWYLGANVPVKDVEYISELKKPDFLYVHISSAGATFNFEKFMLQLSIRLQKFPVLISGGLARMYKKKVPANIYIKRSLQEVTEAFADLNQPTVKFY